MRPLPLPFLFLTLLLSVVCSAAAQAQAVRTWVSGGGVDNAACDRSNPCRTFGAAITAVGTGGEVVVLDSAGYGPVVIDKAVSLISPPGILAAIAPTAGTAITIAAEVTQSKIVLRGLTLNGRGAIRGIFNGEPSEENGNELTVDDCWISGFANWGMHVSRGGLVIVRNTVVRGSFVGISFEPADSDAVLDSVRLEQNGTGLEVFAGRVAVRNSVASLNLFYAFKLGYPGVTRVPVLNIESSQASGNNIGILVQEGRLFLFNSVVSLNAAGISVDGIAAEAWLGGNKINSNSAWGISNDGTIYSKGDNTVQRNTPNLQGDALLFYTTN